MVFQGSSSETTPGSVQNPRQRTLGLDYQDFGDALLVMNPAADVVHVLNPTMAAIWQLCDGTRAAEDIAAALAGAFDCRDAEDLLGSAREALLLLSELNLLESSAPLEAARR